MDDKLDDKKGSKGPKTFKCEICNFECSKKSKYEIHLLTAKHKRMTENDKKGPERSDTLFKCDCGKEYKYRQGLHKHQKKCKYLEKQEEIVEENNDNDPIYKELLIQAMKQMQEQQTQIQEQNKEMTEMRKEMISMIPKIGNTTNSHNTTNNTFNLQFFLNETCKDALNITDFIDSLKLQLEDFEYTAENGHIKGITNIFQTALMNMDQTKRPLHCTDLKRETLYIKDNDEWNKDETKDKMKEAVDKVTNNNLCNMSKWLEKYPGHTDPNSKDFDKYTKMTSNCMGSGEETDNEKIIRNVLKEVQIMK
tara:strand:- start:1115 stop:2038 length:924 start_codon:yes stop_codon:yes gene_type:complete